MFIFSDSPLKIVVFPFLEEISTIWVFIPPSTPGNAQLCGQRRQFFFRSSNFSYLKPNSYNDETIVKKAL